MNCKIIHLFRLLVARLQVQSKSKRAGVVSSNCCHIFLPHKWTSPHSLCVTKTFASFFFFFNRRSCSPSLIPRPQTVSRKAWRERMSVSPLHLCSSFIWGSLARLQHLLTWRRPLSQHHPLVPHRVAEHPQSAHRQQLFLQQNIAQIKRDIQKVPKNLNILDASLKHIQASVLRSFRGPV